MKKKMYQKTITTIFIIQILEIDKEDLHKNNFINAYIKSNDSDLYEKEDVVYLVFKPENEFLFEAFVEKEKTRTKEIIDDYDSDEFIVLVYTINERFKKDIDIIKQSKYSFTSKEFQSMFPEEIINFKNTSSTEILPSIQHMIFRRDKSLLEFWEKEIGTKILSSCNLEAWRAFEIEKETLNIKQVKEELINNQKQENEQKRS